MAGEREIRVQAEGTLRWVQAGSGTGGAVTSGWVTAASPVSGVIGFAGGFTLDRHSNFVTIWNRGIPHHHKRTMNDVVAVGFNVQYGVTADYPPRQPYITASGFSVPQWHLEFKQHTPEIGSGLATGIYYQFHNCVEEGDPFTEAVEGNSVSFKYRALAAVGPTSSGYLS